VPELVERRSAKLSRAVRVEGIREAHLGPRCEYGRVVVEAEPATQFAISFPKEPLSANGEVFARSAVLGLLDVLLTADPFPLHEVALRIVEIQVHPVDSTVVAFRRAGRDAGRKVLEAAGLMAT
jgi:hypothetical protein